MSEAEPAGPLPEPVPDPEPVPAPLPSAKEQIVQASATFAEAVRRASAQRPSAVGDIAVLQAQLVALVLLLVSKDVITLEECAAALVKQVANTRPERAGAEVIQSAIAAAEVVVSAEPKPAPEKP